MPTADELFAAIAAGDTTTIDRIVADQPGLLHAERGGVSSIRAAAYAGHIELVPRLTELGAALDLFDAAAVGEVEQVRALLDVEPDQVSALAGDGFTALHLASWFGRVPVAEVLLAKGADPEALATNGTDLRPLHSAAAGGHEVIAHLLLDRGADIEAQQTGGVRPLHSAAHRNDLPMARLLLGRGADPTAATDDGRTPADLATDAELLALLP